MKTKSEWLATLYYEFGKQHSPMRLTSAYTDEEGEVQFTKWVNYLDAQSDLTLINKCNQREQLKNEIILDFDKGTFEEYKALIQKVKDDGLKFYAYATEEGRARHIHTFWDGLAGLKPSDRKEIRRRIIKTYGCDPNLDTDAHVIPLEYSWHWKTGKEKKLIEENPGINDSHQIIQQIEESKSKTLTGISTIVDPVHKREITEDLAHSFQQNNKVHTTREDERSEIWIYNDGIYISRGKSYIRQHCRTNLQKAYTPHIANEVIAKIEADTYINSQDFFDQNHKGHICTENGILDLKTQKLNPYDPNIVFFSKVPVWYDKDKQCPNIIKFFTDVLKDETDLKVMQELIGYMLWTEYFIEKGFIFSGEGRNGKSKVMSLIKCFLGPQNCSSVPMYKFEKDVFSVSELFGKLANLSGENASTVMKNTEIFKSLTGRDRQSAQRKYLSMLMFENHAKLVFSFNELPLTYDVTTAFFNRIIFFEFPYTFLGKEEIERMSKKDRINTKEKDVDIIKKIATEEELSGMLNWALEGLTRLRKNGEFSANRTTEQVKEWWIRKSDSFRAFIKENVSFDYNTVIPKNELRREYAKYCADNKFKVWGDKHVKSVLSEMGVGEGKKPDESGERVMVWEGIKINHDETVQGVQGGKANHPLGLESFSSKGRNTIARVDTPDRTPEETIQVGKNTHTISEEELIMVLEEAYPENREIHELVKTLGSGVDVILKKLLTEGVIQEVRPGVVRFLQ